MPFERYLQMFVEAEALFPSELQLLADASLELADRYERDAPFMDDEEGRQIALRLSRWRRQRGRYFHELSARAETFESAAMARELPHGWAATPLTGGSG